MIWAIYERSLHHRDSQEAWQLLDTLFCRSAPAIQNTAPRTCIARSPSWLFKSTEQQITRQHLADNVWVCKLICSRSDCASEWVDMNSDPFAINPWAPNREELFHICNVYGAARMSPRPVDSAIQSRLFQFFRTPPSHSLTFVTLVNQYQWTIPRQYAKHAFYDGADTQVYILLYIVFPN